MERSECPNPIVRNYYDNSLWVYDKTKGTYVRDENKEPLNESNLHSKKSKP